MKITIISNYLPPYPGGAGSNVTNLIKKLVQRDEINKISVITMSRDIWPRHEIVSPRLDYYRFFPLNLYFPYPREKKRFTIIKIVWWILNLWNPWTFFHVIRILKKEKPDVVQLHNFNGFSISVISAIQFLKIPFIFIPHDFYLICKNASFKKTKGPVCKKQCRLCSVITAFYKLIITKEIRTIFISEYSSQLLRTFHPNLSGTVTHNPCMVPQEIIKKNMTHRARIAEDKDPCVRFLFVGRVENAKGILTLIDAVKKINVENVFFTFAGPGEYKQLVENFCKQSVNTRYHEFISGDVKHQCFLSHDVLIFPSEWFEVSPLTISEAYAYGLPVVASRIGSIPEHIVEQKTGMLFSPGDSAELARLISQIAGDKRMILNMRKNCFETALSNSIDNHIDKIIQTYKTVITKQ